MVGFGVGPGLGLDLESVLGLVTDLRFGLGLEMGYGLADTGHGWWYDCRGEGGSAENLGSVLDAWMDWRSSCWARYEFVGREGWSQDGLIPEAAYWFVGGRRKCSVEGIMDR